MSTVPPTRPTEDLERLQALAESGAAELGWDAWDGAVVPCILSDEVSGGDLTGLLSVYSLSKQSNLAGYR
ncbi:succinyldiaminopimelate transaminase, partial [Xanthomonas citri pv. citri]|nr:succinyldiaminopimelate transaminase [Xanthomonas citri pv. citri]